MTSIPIVSISCITFNHANFLRECLDSFLMQKTTFPIEILIHDDASIDGTIDIIKEYESKYPEIIKPLIQSENQYSKGARGIMATYNFPRAKGKYIALCEGDDYWTDPYKLQKQVDFLEKNPDYVIHAGRIMVLKDEITSDLFNEINNNKSIYTFDDFLVKNELVTCTVMFRNILNSQTLTMSGVLFADWYLYAYLLNKTNRKAYKSDEFLAVYRSHSGGIMMSLDEVKHLGAYIDQIITIKTLSPHSSDNMKVIEVLNKYSLKKARIELQSQEYCEAMFTLLTNFKISQLKTPLRKYLSIIKQHCSDRIISPRQVQK